MNLFNLLRAILLTLVFSGQAFSQSPQLDTEGLSEEYLKLLEIVKQRHKPVTEIDGKLDVTNRPGIGSHEAEIILVEFGDFECGFCRRHFHQTAQQILDTHVSDNKLRYVFLDYPLNTRHLDAAKAAEAARCAEEQGKYWEMRTELFNNSMSLGEEHLANHASNAGLNGNQFNDCMDSGRHEKAVSEDQLIGKSLGITGTPTFFIGINQGNEIKLLKKIQGSQPFEVFDKALTNAISEPVKSI